MPDDPLGRLRRRLEALLGIPATEGNRLEVLRNGDRIFPAMLGAVASAERSIDFLTFVYWKGDIARRFAHALAERAQHGVRVRVLLDAIGGRLMDSDLIAHMEGCGVQVEWFRKPWLVSPFRQNHRTHRKVLIVDERIGFTGGVGIAEEWEGDARDVSEWRDTHVRVVGPAVDGLAAAFAQNWAETGRPLYDETDTFPVHERAGTSVVQVIRGSASVGWNDMATVFRVMLESASSRVRLTTAYFVPDRTFEHLLLGAVRRGVQVDVLLPGPGADKRVCQIASESTYDRLTKGGVRLWNFQPSMLHAKILTIDDCATVIGSANFNNRSMQHDEEVVLCVLDEAVTTTLVEHFEDDLTRSVRIDRDRWQERGPVQKGAEAATTVLKRWF
ncbi:MAG: phospholipase D-like domain-containing protein [Actinomycetota bacterium]|nr:phospholipase D-like domain-containing protein [Actinomycetota bacterium]